MGLGDRSGGCSSPAIDDWAVHYRLRKAECLEDHMGWSS